MVIYLEAKTFNDDLRNYAAMYEKSIVSGMTIEEKANEADVFFEEVLWSCCIELEIRYEIGTSWEHVEYIRDSLETERKVP